MRLLVRVFGSAANQFMKLASRSLTWTLQGEVSGSGYATFPILWTYGADLDSFWRFKFFEDAEMRPIYTLPVSNFGASVCSDLQGNRKNL